MGLFVTNASDYNLIKTELGTLRFLKKEKFEKFNPSILELGDITRTSKTVHALSAIFDLEGFTNFCRQIDPQLAVPEYLSQFLPWLFNKIREETKGNELPEGYGMYSPLPFLAKYLGDGVLFIWNTEGMSDLIIRNIVVELLEVCDDYMSEFIPLISSNVTSIPPKLRCGIARGDIYSVGSGNDFVGPSINMASRLQKLNSLSFCFARRGIDPRGTTPLNEFIVKKTEIRGIGSDELVCVIESEYEKLDKEIKAKFRDP